MVAIGCDSRPLFPPRPRKSFRSAHLRTAYGEMVFYRGDGPRDLVIGEVGNLDGRILASEGEEAIGEFSNWMAAAPRFSPDGRQVLFATSGGDVWIVAADGTGKKKVGTVDPDEWEGQTSKRLQSIAWHPQGTHVVFDNWGALYVANVETGEQRKFTIDDARIEWLTVLDWSPDSAHIVIKGMRTPSMCADPNDGLAVERRNQPDGVPSIASARVHAHRSVPAQPGPRHGVHGVCACARLSP